LCRYAGGKVAVSMRARRVYGVNTVDETFGVLLHFIFMWELPSWEKPPPNNRYANGAKPEWRGCTSGKSCTK
jgi:hypothetical protein